MRIRLAAVAWGEGFEEEAGAGGFGAGLGGGVLEAGGVLDGEAEFVEGVRGAGEGGGELGAVGEGFVLIERDAAEGAEGGAERGGIGGEPAFLFQVGGVFDGGVEGLLRADELGGEVLRVVDADLELGAQLHVVARECLPRGAARAGCEGGGLEHIGRICPIAIGITASHVISPGRGSHRGREEGDLCGKSQ